VARALPKTQLPADTVSLGESARGGVELFAMFPAKLTVNAGTTVTFQMSRKSFETHTATFGPKSYLAPLAKSFTGAISPTAAYPSSPPVQPITLTPTSHGNGFANTGALDANPASTQIPSSGRIDFTTPGTYQFVCLIHPFMVGTIVVK
jgi:plastocyanin